MESEPERGRLLFKESWADKNYIHKDKIVFGIVLLVLASMVISFSVYMVIFSSKEIGDQIYILLVGFVVGFMFSVFGYMLLENSFTRMPLKIYEDGFTLPMVPMKRGLKRREKFIKWSELKSIFLDAPYMGSDENIIIDFRYDEGEARINIHELYDTEKAVEFFNKLVPDNIDEKLLSLNLNEDE